MFEGSLKEFDFKIACCLRFSFIDGEFGGIGGFGKRGLLRPPFPIASGCWWDNNDTMV